MAASIASLLNSSDHAALVDGVYQALTDHHGPTVDIGRIPVEHRTAILVEYSSGIIQNGGFTALFGSELPGDPDYQLLLAAYESLGDGPATRAIQRVFDIFPDCIPPTDREERFLMFARGNQAADGRLNTDFLKACDVLVADLAVYIRTHRRAFIELDAPPRRPRKPRGASGSVDQVGVGSSRFPKWARVAFYARCARLVLPLWEHAWPDSPPEHRKAVEQAIRLAEVSAAKGKPVGDLKTASGDAISAGGAAMVTQYGIKFEDGEPDDPPARDPYLALNVANAAAKAVDLARGAGDSESYGFVKGAIEIAGRVDLMDQVQNEFRLLRRFVRVAGWGDRTPVSPEVFEPGYEPVKKPWWKLW